MTQGILAKELMILIEFPFVKLIVMVINQQFKEDPQKVHRTVHAVSIYSDPPSSSLVKEQQQVLTT